MTRLSFSITITIHEDGTISVDDNDKLSPIDTFDLIETTITEHRNMVLAVNDRAKRAIEPRRNNETPN